MSTTAIHSPPLPAAPPDSVPAAVAIPSHVWAVLFASTSVIVGVLWDISWHESIGRDSFWSPPHMAIYLGGIVAGLACGWHVLRATFRSDAPDREATVRFWKWFRGSLGAWLCIWGAFAMLTSAPFDDWWHNAYGLDVEILSPPHVVLALGILAIQAGALLMVLALQNRSEAAAGRDAGATRILRWMFVYAAALVLMNFAVMTTEYSYRIYQHRPEFYIANALLVPLVLAATARAGTLRWPATTASLIYFVAVMLMVWIFPLFPAEPKLAPIRFSLEQMTPPQFPRFFFASAIVLDLLHRRFGGRLRDWRLAAVMGTAFLVAFFAAHWTTSYFLNSELARNPLFGQHLRPYMVAADSFYARGEFYMEGVTTATLARGLAVALVAAVLSTRVGLAAGAWMRRVRR